MKTMTQVLCAAGASFLISNFAFAAESCEPTTEGFFPCAEGQVLNEEKATSGELKQDARYMGHHHRRHPRHPRHRYPHPRYPHPIPPVYPHYPPVAYPAPFCYTPSGVCRMAVPTPPGYICTCNFGYFFDQGRTGY